MSKLTQADLKANVLYNPEHGFFIRLKSVPHSPAGTVLDVIDDPALGYIKFSVAGVRLYAHRAAWFYMTGEWPKYIDHRDGNRANNKWKNLRNGRQSQNLENYKKPNSGNTSGYLGVWTRKDGKYVAEIHVNKKKVNLGVFEVAAEAGSAYLAAKRKLHEFNTL